MTGPRIDPEEIPGWLDKYFANLQAAHSLPAADATAVKAPPRFQAPATATIGAQGPGYPAAQFNPLYSAYGGIHDFLAKRIKGYSPKDAFGDVAGATGAKDIFQGLGNANAGQLAGGVLAAATLPLGGEGKVAKTVLKDANPEVMKILEGLRTTKPMDRITAIDAAKASHMAKVYEGLPKFDPAAKSAYDALNSEVAAQHKALMDAGYKFDFVNEDPYKSSAEMMKDVRENKTLKVFKTPSDNFHPYMTPEQNDVFRGVHDLLAHAGEGNQFGPVGEENAYRVHASTVSPEARRALAAETRGQNSWVNFGPNAHLPVRERPFAEQKAALWPEHLTGDYHEMPPVDGQKFAVLTAENPSGMFGSGTVNAARNSALERRMMADNVHFTPVTGAYTDEKTGNLLHENSYLLHDVEPAYAEQLGRDFNQNGVVTHQGYHNLARGVLHPSRELLGGVQDAPWTQLPSGHKFSADIDWSQAAEQPLAQPHDAPNVNSIRPWRPISRGIFDRSAPNIQGTMPSDPRLVVPEPTSRMSVSPLVDAVVNSRTVAAGLDKDVAKGATAGGPEWYELGPVKADLDSRAGTGGMSFNDMNTLGGAASASNTIPNEISAMTVSNYARKRGLDRETAVQHFLKQTRSPIKPAMMDMHYNNGLRGLVEGTVLPTKPTSDAWKIPSYVDKRNGGGGVLDVDAPGAMPALDTHERRRIMQLVMENPRLRKLAIANGADPSDIKAVLPFRNALDYKAISQMYVDGAKRWGLPTAGAYQAPRWLGGWKETGLESPPTGDFVQHLEDAIKYSAQVRGLPDDPASLRKYWARIVAGNDFILPYAKSGGYPIK